MTQRMKELRVNALQTCPSRAPLLGLPGMGSAARTCSLAPSQWCNYAAMSKHLDTMKTRLWQAALGRSSTPLSLRISPGSKTDSSDSDWAICALVAGHQLAMVTNLIKQLTRMEGDHVPKELLEMQLAYIQETPVDIASRALDCNMTTEETWQLMMILAVENSERNIFQLRGFHSNKIREMIRETKGGEKVRKEHMRGPEIVLSIPNKGNQVILEPRQQPMQPLPSNLAQPTATQLQEKRKLKDTKYRKRAEIRKQEKLMRQTAKYKEFKLDKKKTLEKRTLIKKVRKLETLVSAMKIDANKPQGNAVGRLEEGPFGLVHLQPAFMAGLPQQYDLNAKPLRSRKPNPQVSSPATLEGRK